MIEYGWAHEIAFVEAVAGSALATANQGRAIFAADIQIFQDSLELTLVDARPHLGLRIVAVADAH